MSRLTYAFDLAPAQGTTCTTTSRAQAKPQKSILEEISPGSFLPSVRERWHRRWLGVGGPSPPAQRTCTARLYRVRVHACVERGPPDRPVLPLSIAMSAHVAAALVVGDDNVAPQRVLHLRVGYVHGPCAPRDARIKAFKPPF